MHMVDNLCRVLFLDTSKNITPTIIKLSEIKCITLASIVNTPKIRKYYLQKFNLALVLSASKLKREVLK